MSNDLISRCKLFNALAPVQTLGEAYGIIQEMPTVDAIPIDWINLFNSTPIGGDSIDDMLLEWRYQQEVEAERERDGDGNDAD